MPVMVDSEGKYVSFTPTVPVAAGSIIVLGLVGFVVTCSHESSPKPVPVARISSSATGSGTSRSPHMPTRESPE
jgi:hypothetical protein